MELSNSLLLWSLFKESKDKTKSKLARLAQHRWLKTLLYLFAFLLSKKQEGKSIEADENASQHIETVVGRKTSVTAEMADKLDAAVKDNNEEAIKEVQGEMTKIEDGLTEDEAAKVIQTMFRYEDTILYMVIFSALLLTRNIYERLWR